MSDYIARAGAFLEAADLIASKDHREGKLADQHDVGWRHALNEAEHNLRIRAEEILDEAEGIRR